jgi:heme-degrading monooxygenase HmoA
MEDMIMEQVMESIDAEGRTATPRTDAGTGPVTLVNSFVVPEGRDEAFLELWTETSEYFRRHPGFVSLRLHRATSADARYRFVNVVQWASAAEYLAPHQTDEFRRLVSQPAMREFPSTPTLYEVVVTAERQPAPGES